MIVGQLLWRTIAAAQRVLVARRSSLVGLAMLLGLALILPALGRAQEGQNQAGVVVQHGNGQVVTACVSFSEPSISGIELLRRSGLGVVSQGGGMGEAVCKLDGEGCDYPAEDCFCRRDGGQAVYWSFFVPGDGGWRYSAVGASSVQVGPGEVNGWAWGSGKALPPQLSIGEVCAVPGSAPPADAQPPQPTAAPPATATPTAAPSQPPTVTPATATAAPSQASTAAATATRQPATAAPTAVASAGQTTIPLPTATASLVPTPTPDLSSRPAGGAVPEPPGDGPAGRPEVPASYVAFGALALALAGGIVAAARRRG